MLTGNPLSSRSRAGLTFAANVMRRLPLCLTGSQKGRKRTAGHELGSSFDQLLCLFGVPSIQIVAEPFLFPRMVGQPRQPVHAEGQWILNLVE
jgi:hypothetical protein